MKSLIKLSFFLLFLVFSCGKKPIHTHTKETYVDSVSIKKIIDRNARITDSLFHKLGEVRTVKPECDSITKAYLENFLKTLNTKKKSGGNEYGFYYDEMQKMLVMYANLAETVNEQNESKTAKVETSSKTETIQVRYVPKWVAGLAFLGVFAIFFIVYRISRIFT